MLYVICYILYDDFDQKVKIIHDDMDLHHSYKKSVYLVRVFFVRTLQISKH